jgi:RND family efflux transporter MFP subunit
MLAWYAIQTFFSIKPCDKPTMQNKLCFFKRRYVLTLLLGLLILLLVLKIVAHLHMRHKENKVVTVNVAVVETKPMPLLLQTSGNLEPLQSVNVRSQVTGVIKKIDFNPGESVRADQLLFEINPAPYQAALQHAKDVLQRDQAQLNSTVTDEKRFSKLAQSGYLSKQDYDHIQATAAMQSATVKADQENVKAAEIQLQYSQIRAPIAGQTGNVSVKQGDLITAESTNPLVTINQINPVLVNFNLSQNKLPKLLMYQNRAPIRVEVWSESGHHLLGTGHLIFIDNNVNAETGTVLLKASIANEQHILWPGLMVMVKIILTMEKNALVLSSQAVQVDQQGQFVYQVKNHKAVIQRIKVDRQEGNLSVISEGLQAGEQVITVMPPDLENGSSVKIFPTKIS